MDIYRIWTTLIPPPTSSSTREYPSISRPRPLIRLCPPYRWRTTPFSSSATSKCKITPVTLSTSGDSYGTVQWGKEVDRRGFMDVTGSMRSRSSVFRQTGRTGSMRLGGTSRSTFCAGLTAGQNDRVDVSISQ